MAEFTIVKVVGLAQVLSIPFVYRLVRMELTVRPPVDIKFARVPEPKATEEKVKIDVRVTADGV